MSFVSDNFLQLCRLCACRQSTKTELFGKEGRERNLVEKIEICLPFKIYEHDTLPKSLCYRCMYLLENFYDFRKNCVKSVYLLESYISDPEGNKMKPGMRLEFEQLKSQLQHLEQQRGKEEHDLKEELDLKEEFYVKEELDLKEAHDLDFMPHLEPQVPPAGAYSHSRRSSSEATRPSPVCSPPCLERNEDSVGNLTDCKPEKELVDSDSSSRETVRIQTRRRLNRSPMHACKVCSRTFVSWSQLNVHSRSHARDAEGQSEPRQPFTCDLCCKSYALPKHLWTHVSMAHRGDPAITCNLCQRVCMSQARLDEHRQASHGLEEAEPEPRMHMQAMLNMLLNQREALQHVCASCEQVFASEVELKQHVTSQQCVVARKQLAEMSLLKQTLLNSKRDSAEMSVRKRSLSSDFLEELYLESPTRKKQVSATNQNGHSGNRRKNSRPRKIARDRAVNICEEAHSEEQFTCDVCLVVFQTSGQLADHKVIHESVEEVVDAGTSRDKPFTCLLCDKSFSVRQSLSRHLLACHGIDPQEVTNTLNKHIGSNTSTEVRKPNISYTDDAAALAAVTMGSMEYADDQSNKNFYSCEVCIREFNDRSSLWLHMLYAHKEQAMYACGICLKVCMNNSHLMTHWKEHGNVVEQRRYVCQICGRQHDTRKKLVIHVGVHCLDNGQGGTYDPEAIVLQNHAFYNPEQKAKDAEGGLDANSPECKPEVQVSREAANDFTCEVCYKVFLSEEKLVKHKKNSHKEETSSNTYRGTYQLFFVCELCGSSHHSKSERWRHVYKCHGGETILRCDRGTCGKVFTTRALRHEHCTNHHQLQGDIPNTCEVCGKLWGSRVDFWKHMMGVHSDLVPLTCGVCLKILCDVGELKAHVKKKHSPLMGDFCCEICGRSYSNQSKMSRHRKIHEVSDNNKVVEESVVSIKKPSKLIAGKNESEPCSPKLSCDVCPEQQFTSLSQLTQHRRNAHSLFPCDICTKFYGRTTHLLNHVRRKHKDEPQLSCPVCFKLCSSKVGVSLHIAKNHAPKEEVVKLKKKFPTFKTSKGTYGQKCSFCSKTFWKRLVYRKHMRGCRNKMVVDSSSIQTCELCNVKCSSKIKLLQHIRGQHPGHPNFTCNIEDCTRVMRSLAELELHLKMHTADVGMATCDVCGEVYDSEIKIWRHLYNSHRLRELDGLCGICLRALQTVEELRTHVEAAHPGACEKPNTCKLCARTYTGAYKVLLHVAKCHSSYSVCKVCLEMFTDPSQLATHAELHQDEDYDDDAGDSKENSKAEQEAEKQSMVIVPEKRQSLESDEVKTAGKRPKRSYDCELCTRSFHSPSALSEHKKQFHMATPSEFKPYHCSTCIKHFSNKTSYWKHINSPSHASVTRMAVGITSHGVQKQNELVESQEDSRASYAGSESFDSNHSLQGEENFDQESTHSPSRRRSETRKVYSADATVPGPYFCCLCGKKWPGRKHLWQHLIRNHRNEAAVTCGVCLTVCSDYRDLSRHLSVQHPDNFKGDGNNFTCRTCGRYHNARCKLLQHVLIHIVLGPGPEKQPPSLTEIIESRGVKGEGSPCEMSPLMLGDQPLASHEQVEELPGVYESGAENPNLLAADIELSCQHCNKSFDSLEELLKHQDVCQEVMLPVVNRVHSKMEPQSLGGDSNLLEESQDSSSRSSLDNIGSPFDTCTNDYVVGNSITNDDDGDDDDNNDDLPANIDNEVFGDDTELQQELQLNHSALDCMDSGSCENVPQSDVETTEKSDASPIGDGDMIEGSYFEEDSLGDLSYESKGCIIGMPIGKKEDSSGREEGKKGIFMDSQNTKVHTYEVDAAVEVTFESDCRDDERCHMVSNGLPDSEGSSMETAVCELEPLSRASEKVLLHRGNIANVATDNLNSLDMLSMIESVDM